MLQLKTIGIVVKESDVSPFEVIHSGLIQALLQFLTSQAMSTERDLRLRQFLHVFLNCPVCALCVLLHVFEVDG